MRMIVEAFKETLELGLQKHGQIVVRLSRLASQRSRSSGLITFHYAAHDSYLCIWLADWPRGWRLSSRRSG